MRALDGERLRERIECTGVVYVIVVVHVELDQAVSGVDAVVPAQPTIICAEPLVTVLVPLGPRPLLAVPYVDEAARHDARRFQPLGELLSRFSCSVAHSSPPTSSGVCLSGA